MQAPDEAAVRSSSYNNGYGSSSPASKRDTQSSTPTGSGSTGRYEEQEPFETIRHRVAPLCQSIGVGTPSGVQRIHGGSFNRVVGITFSENHHDSYVLRIPRFSLDADEVKDFKDQIAIAQALGTRLPLPTIIAYDATSSNAISRQYTLQTRIKGGCLSSLYDKLSFEERLHVASLVSAIIVRMEQTTFSTAGRLVSASPLPDCCNDSTSLDTAIAVAPFRIDRQPGPDLAPNQSVKDILDLLINAQLAYCNPRNSELLTMWRTLHEIMLEMGSMGFLNDSNAVLWHWDFAARNIMVDRVKDDLLEITGVLDWDDVLSVPRVLSRKPPAWLWHIGREPSAWSGDLDFLEQQRPLTKDELAIKQHFDETMEELLPGYYKDAYEHGRWVRRLARFALHGFGYSQDWKRYDVFVEEWRNNALHPLYGHSKPTCC